MPRYSRRKCAASKRAETRTVKRGLTAAPKTRSIISSLIPSSRTSPGVDCDRSKSSARRSSQQSAGLDPLASSMSVCKVLRRAASSVGSTAEVYNAPPDDAPAEKHPLHSLQEDLSRRLEALSLLRFR